MAQKELTPEQQVNRLGKYLYKHIDGVESIKYSPMNCDVFMFMYYQIPGESDSMKTMHFDINITSYQKKIRVNVTEVTDMEKTIGHAVYKPEELIDLNSAFNKIYEKICHQIEREYEEYDFVF